MQTCAFLNGVCHSVLCSFSSWKTRVHDILYKIILFTLHIILLTLVWFEVVNTLIYGGSFLPRLKNIRWKWKITVIISESEPCLLMFVHTFFFKNYINNIKYAKYILSQKSCFKFKFQVQMYMYSCVYVIIIKVIVCFRCTWPVSPCWSFWLELHQSTG